MALTNPQARDQYLLNIKRAGRSAGNWRAIVPSDGANLNFVPRALLISADAIVTCIGCMADDSVVAGEPLPLLRGYNDISPRKIFATGTGAVSIWGLE